MRPRSGGLEAEAVKQDRGKLLGGVEVEGFSDRLVDLLFESRQALIQFHREGAKEFFVQGDAGHFHIRQDGDERHFDIDKKIP